MRRTRALPATSSCQCACDRQTGGTGQDISSALLDLQLEHFRCFATAELRFAPRLNVITGANAAGKTSLLEAIYLLGRGRSFRTADLRNLVQSATTSALVTGRAAGRAGPVPLGIRLGTGGPEIHVGGRASATAADLAAQLPVQALHAEIGELVHGGPEVRRRLLDWGVFHVEQGYLDQWRRCRRALLQRNTAIRDHQPDAVLEAWEGEIAAAAEGVDRDRAAYFAKLLPVFQRLGSRLLGAGVEMTYQRGWPGDQDLRAVLRENRDADRRLGYTRAGPQRADLGIRIEAGNSRWRASRGQQKLVGAALVLAECERVAAATGTAIALVVDEPGADLDRGRLAALLEAILDSPAQVFLAALSVEGLALPAGAGMFHVEHGQAKALL